MTTPTDLLTNPSSADAVLRELDPEQREVATATRGPVCVLAGAGTGKTRAITHRIAYGVHSGVLQPQQVLAVSFTSRAAGEMRGRLRQLGAEGVQARTFHSAALRQLRFFWPRAVGGEAPPLVERKAQLVAEAASRCRLRVNRAELRDLTSEIEWAKVSQVAAEDYAAAVTAASRETPREPAETARVYASYEQLKREHTVIDFEDVLLLTAGILQDRPDVAETVRAQYRHFVVDEYQDVSPLQHRLLQLWLGERDSLCVVGDASQTIYSFTGATPDFLLDFRTQHPDATVVKLVRDYRSTPQVVHLANSLLQQARGQTAQHRLELVAQRDAGPEPGYTEFQDEPAEAEGVARRIRELLDDGVPASEIAVLFRTNGQSEVYEQALVDADVPYRLRGAERFFERPEVREAITLLRGAARSPDAGGLSAGPDDQLVDRVRAVFSNRGWTPQPPSGSGAARERWESLAALVRLAEDFAAAHPTAGLDAFLTEVDGRATVQHAPTVEGVTLASLHAAKGLEWDAVFLVGLVEGMMPIAYATTERAIEEERRLLYVGVTRARRHLALSWWLSRTPGGRAGRQPSRFLDGQRPGSHGPRPPAQRRGDGAGVSRTGSGGGSGKRGPVRCRVCDRALVEPKERKLRRCLDCPSDLDEALFERLRQWRTEQAQEQKLPAYCVFTDATLTAIAEAQPTEVAALSRIPGVGQAKLDRYAQQVLTLCRGEGDTGDADAGEETETRVPLDVADEPGDTESM